MMCTSTGCFVESNALPIMRSSRARVRIKRRRLRQRTEALARPALFGAFSTFLLSAMNCLKSPNFNYTQRETCNSLVRLPCYDAINSCSSEVADETFRTVHSPRVRFVSWPCFAREGRFGRRNPDSPAGTRMEPGRNEAGDWRGGQSGCRYARLHRLRRHIHEQKR